MIISNKHSCYKFLKERKKSKLRERKEKMASLTQENITK